MAKANTAAALTMTRADAEQKLKERIRLGEEALDRGQLEPFPGWHDYNKQLLTQMFTTPDFADQYDGAGIYRGPVVVLRDGRTVPAPTPPEHILRARVGKLDSICQQLELFQEPISPKQQLLRAYPVRRSS